MREQLRQGQVLVSNWHALNWDTEEQIAKRRGVDKRGAKSDEAYVRDVLAEMARAQNIVVINDEAHHAWRVPAESKIKGVATTERRVQFIERNGAVLDESPAAYHQWRSLLVQHQIQGLATHDARLVSMMQLAGITHFVTLNVADFARYPGIVPITPKDFVASRKP